MKKPVRLTESDLTRIVKRVMNEGVIQELTPSEMAAKLQGTTMQKPKNVQVYQDGDGFIITGPYLGYIRVSCS